jgi:hypothetical protein
MPLAETMALAQGWPLLKGWQPSADRGRQKRRSHLARKLKDREQAEGEYPDIERKGLTG